MLVIARNAVRTANSANALPGCFPRNAWGSAFIGLGSQQTPSQGEPVEREVKRRKTSHVQRDQSAEHFRPPAKNPERPLLKPGMAVERERQSRHQQWAQCQAAMRGLITGEASRLETLRQHNGLAEGQAETFASDRIDGAGSVADQHDIASPHTLQLAIGGHGSSFSRNRFSSP